MPGRSPSVISFVLMSKTPTYSVVLTGRSIPPRRATVNLDGTDSPRLRRNHRQTDKRGPTRTGESGLRAARTAFPGARGGTRKFLGTPSRNHEVLQDAPMSCGSCRSCRSCPGTRQDERSCVPPVKSTQSRPSTPGPAPRAGTKLCIPVHDLQLASALCYTRSGVRTRRPT